MSNIEITKGSILSFGELLLRMCPDGEGQWLAKNKLPFFMGGAELNVANALALWGQPIKYFTALPDNALSEQIISYLESKSIDTSAIHHSGNRIGLYYLTRGKDVKNNAIVYDRAGSSFADLKPGMVNWDAVLEGVSWFHFSAICPALNQLAADVCEEVLQAASKKHITISVDLNYRPKLWQYGKKPVEIMPKLVQYADIIMGNVWAEETMLGIPVTPDMHESGQQSIYLKEGLYSSERIMDAYPRCRAVANTFRFDAGKGVEYYTSLYTGNRFYHSPTYTTETVVDKVGSGDCFMAGLIYGFYNKQDPQQLLDFATAAAFEKLFIEGDATTKTVDQIYNAMKQ
ncbi:sugar kinase [Mucilaginibacter rubeus]|uniref:Sugar kinase n=1 Tax=Mucilaginibacter rubeus TaxID=2027860 RepID=A0AAE6JEC3_9SPHI|nr:MULTISPECIES: sugar kinase [Mucilaginibacter]QEM03841.1 sugar kinase [Mucilaginibacter rubeus]QEM16451.1 sugar kinase [Mucilaginibacter gossypii]QTE40781.1 sugar kinase [Mucilaginibacter rubeus]QTE47383.1 sugar kinase [Mucilaginibacter rubeus]QTE58777.1 sugar kinase [Mucilaginibacter rubeus]